MIIEQGKNDHAAEYVSKKLLEYNQSKISSGLSQEFEPINLFVKNADGDILGGLLAMAYWGSMEVNVLWVDDSLRGQGYGARLLSQMEDIAVAKRCNSIELTTFGFQAPGFYEKQGYKLCGVYENVPKGYNRYFYLKHLTD